MANATVDRWANVVILILCIGLAVMVVVGTCVGCGPKIQTLQMVIDGNGRVVGAEWFWVDKHQDYCRLEAVRDPAWLRVGCRNGDVLAY